MSILYREVRFVLKMKNTNKLMSTGCVSYFLVMPPHEWSDLSGHCGVNMVVWLFVCLLAQIQNFENFIEYQKFQNENMFQSIQCNFDFFTPEPPLHHI